HVVQRQRRIAARQRLFRPWQALLEGADPQQPLSDSQHVRPPQAGSSPGTSSSSQMGATPVVSKASAAMMSSASGRAESGTQTRSTPNSGNSPPAPSSDSPSTKAGMPASSSACL